MPWIWERMPLNCHFRFGNWANKQSNSTIETTFTNFHSIFRMPFDSKTPIGYTMAFILQYISLICVAKFAAAAISLEISCYLIGMTFIKDVQSDFRSMNKLAKSKKNRSQTILSKLRDTINFHAELKGFDYNCSFSRFANWMNNFPISLRFVGDLSLIIRPMLSTLFSWTIVTMCSALLIGQMLIVQ